MECPQLFKVSLLVDGELTPDEEARLREHLGDCPQCRQAWADFSDMRREIRSIEPQAVQNAEHVLANILAPPKSGFWHRTIQVPAPLAAAAVVLLAVLVLWMGTLQWGRTSAPGSAPDSLVSQGQGIDLARFDHGGRPLLFKRPKPEGPVGEESDTRERKP